ncbi:MAG: hypothetical protein K8H86_04085 [Ignavibacteriaceae bacterium]|nr:hypothetical protein [Ignavibacteriaceae bacterium]
MKKSFLIYLLLLAPLAFSQNEIVSIPTKVDTPQYLKNPLYHQALGLYEISRIKQADIVMLGNSNIYGADWSELLGRTNVVNRGITSDVIEGYISRLNYVVTLNPKIVFISGGLNDVYNWFPLSVIMSNYTFLVEQLKKRGIIVVVQSTFHVLSSWHAADTRNPEIDKLNILLKDYCKKEGVEFIDLVPLMSRKGAFREEYANSWGHINPRGYKVWADQVDKVLRKLGF